MSRTPECASAPSAGGCPEPKNASDLIEDDAARRRERFITTLQNGLLWLLPSGVMAAVHSPGALQPGLLSGVAMLGVQHLTALCFDGAADDDGDTAEILPIGVGALAALVVMSISTPLTATKLIISLLVASLLLFWPRTFHRIRGACFTDFERMRQRHAHPAPQPPATTPDQPNSLAQSGVTNGAQRLH